MIRSKPDPYFLCEGAGAARLSAHMVYTEIYKQTISTSQMIDIVEAFAREN